MIATPTKVDENLLKYATPFPLSEVNADTFVPYAELTEADVIGWVQAVVGSSG